MIKILMKFHIILFIWLVLIANIASAECVRYMPLPLSVDTAPNLDGLAPLEDYTIQGH